MAKKNKSKNQSGLKKVNYTVGRPNRSPRSTMGGPPRDNSTVSLAKALADPFSPTCRGVKIPDDDSSRSVPITIVNRFNHTTLAGQQVLCLKPSLQNHLTVSGTVASSIVTVWGTVYPIADYATIAASFASYRIVSWGFRVQSLDPPTVQAGSMETQTNSVDPTTIATYSLASGFFEEIQVMPVAGSDLHWISKPQGVGWKEYKAMTADHDWTNAVIHFNGASTTQKFRIEVYMNLECQVGLGQLSGALATPAGDHNPHALALVDHVRNRVAHAHPNRPSLLSAIGKQLYNGAIALADMALPRMGGALLRAITGANRQPMIMDVD